MKMQYWRIVKLLVVLLLLNGLYANAQRDTLRVMAYNVLHYGDGCQGSNTFLHSQLKTIIQYTKPDLVGFVKAQAIKRTPTDNNGISPYGFADSIITYALDAVFPGRYNYCPFTNVSGSSDMDILFYNQNKLGFVSVRTLYTVPEDFDLYKLYYKDPFLNATHDTTFLYIILNHTVSGSSSTQRDQQDTLIINQLKKIFYHLPNLISMGDFNTHSSLEQGYVAYTNASDSSYSFYDPPFYPDNKLNYPLNWESFPTSCPGYLNTTTRQSATYPNSCGTSDGAKDWFLHTFLSGWLIHNTDYIKYMGNSYTTVGNDGNRIGISINDSTTNGKNLSAPANVINAIFQLSDKYPIMVELGINYDSLGNGPVDPVNSVNSVTLVKQEIKVNNPVSNNVVIHFPSSLMGEKCSVNCFDVCGRNIISEEINISSSTVTLPANFHAGTYILRLLTKRGVFAYRIVKL